MCNSTGRVLRRLLYVTHTKVNTYYGKQSKQSSSYEQKKNTLKPNQQYKISTLKKQIKESKIHLSTGITVKHLWNSNGEFMLNKSDVKLRIKTRTSVESTGQFMCD